MKQNINPSAARAFATQVVQTLRDAGFEALWAGGCVRDELLGKQPNDYDVATNAQPAAIRELFGRNRTLAIGEAFGVVAVRGPRAAGNVEIATFRQDAEYSDGRRPDRVTFSTAEEDAERRDFTINGLFYDPIEDRVIDYVGGRDDLKQRRIRAIGDPHKRIAEDKLRMLRGVRFAAAFSYELEKNTFDAIRCHAADVRVVSGERIGAEMQRMLAHPTRARALEILRQTHLLKQVLPETDDLFTEADGAPSRQWNETLAALELLAEPCFAGALSLILRTVPPAAQHRSELASVACRRWRLANRIVAQVEWLLLNETVVRQATDLSWPQVQRVLAAPHREALVNYAAAIAHVADDPPRHIAFCREKLALPSAVLDPPPLITGGDLAQLGAAPGPLYATILREVRDLQLVGQLESKAAAVEMARSLLERNASN